MYLKFLKQEDFVFLFLICVFSLLGVSALFAPGLFSAHDIWHQVARLYHYQAAVSDGQFPPYWVGNLANGLGYPLFIFSYHLPWIFGLSFLSFGATIPFTIKALFVLSYVLSGIFMYLFAKDFLQSGKAAFLASFLYLWAPYRFLTIFVYAALGTAFVFTFLPVLFWGVYRIYKGRFCSGVLLFSTSFAAIALSHLTTLVYILPSVSLFCIWAFLKSKNRFAFFKFGLLGLCLGAGLSAFYLFPVVYYNKLTHFEEFFKGLYKQNLAGFQQIVYSKWGYGLFKESVTEGAFSLQLGITHWIAVLLTFLSILEKRRNLLTLILLISFAISIFLMTGHSRLFWDFVSKIFVVDNPTGLLLPTVFVSSLLAGVVFKSLKENWQFLFFVFLVTAALYTNRNHLRVNMYTDFPVSLYVESETTTNSFHEYLPKSASLALLSKNISLVEPKSVETQDLFQNTNTLSFTAAASSPSPVLVRHLSFPGINVYLNGKKINYTASEDGRVSFLLPSGIHKIVVKFEDTVLTKISKIVSLLSVFFLCFFLKKYGKTP